MLAGYVWTSNLQPIYYTDEGHDLIINFSADINADNFLLKLNNDDLNVSCIIRINKTDVMLDLPRHHHGYLSLDYVNSTGSVLVTLKNARHEHTGNYSVTVMTGDNIVLRHRFKVVVLSGDVPIYANLTCLSNCL